ncbi:hypothetical protein [[Mycoplasma] collis]|uniref:hypothetical protein n=1 Tax=[Mycoplasma] collis TaxID=2127 RepID=UPI00051B488A|nr:hypothetical protein [[Mycoplasma] collis]
MKIIKKNNQNFNALFWLWIVSLGSIALELFSLRIPVEFSIGSPISISFPIFYLIMVIVSFILILISSILTVFKAENEKKQHILNDKNSWNK